MQNELEYEFFMSQLHFIQDIKENEKIKIILVFYDRIGAPCILKICKNRDLSAVCWQLKEIRHPNVAVVYDSVYANHHTYILEEYINGMTLYELLVQNGGFSEKQTAQIMIEVCKGLEILHSHQPPIVHNDINTSNIMIREDGSVKLFDFDISRTFKIGAGKNTRLFGTEEYAAPEHFGYGQSEPRTDIYSLGVTMHEMLTGTQLTNEHKMSYKGKLRKIIGKCIEIDPKKRYASAGQLKKALNKYRRRAFRFFKKAGFLLVILLLIAGSIFLYKNMADSRKPAENFKDDRSETIEEQLPEQETETPETNSKEENSEEETAEREASDEREEDLTAEPEKAVKKKMEVVYQVTGELYSMVAQNDGTFITLEREEGGYYIKTSTGITKKMEDVNGSLGARLVYDPYSDALYLFDCDSSEMRIFNVQDDFTVEAAAVLDGDFGFDINDALCNFFSDGNMILNQMYSFVDSKTWTVVGGAPAMVYVINDRMYQRNAGILFMEVDAEGNVIAEYDPDEIDGNPYETEIYIDGNYAYFIGSEIDDQGNAHDYVYRFDGENFDKVAYLNEYQYYSPFIYDHLCVTEQSIRCYDTQSKVIKEFKLN